MEKVNHKTCDVVVIGAGLTGLTTAYWLKRKGVDVVVVEKSDRTGGQIRTEQALGFTYETGPTTSAVSTPEVAELMTDLYHVSGGKCQLETAPDTAKRRLIWKDGRFHDLPSGPLKGLTTPLFRLSDKFRILAEPWRSPGTKQDETVGELAARRLGQSFVDYAVDPFISGVYAGDPYQLVTRYALPKLYALEQEYGSFIRGAIAKKKQPKTERDKLATKKVFSARGGMSRIIEALTDYLGPEQILLGCADVKAEPFVNHKWKTSFTDKAGKLCTIESGYVVTTCGAYALPDILPFVHPSDMDPIASLVYAPVMEVNVGVNDDHGGDYQAFGGLVPSKEQRRVLGILFPSSCFSGRAPQGGALFSFFIGGVRHPEMLRMTDNEVHALVTEELHDMLGFPRDVKPDFIHISRHWQAIPQYRADSGERFEAVWRLQDGFNGLYVAGNLRDGIGMGHRITQATNIATDITNKLNNQ